MPLFIMPNHCSNTLTISGITEYQWSEIAATIDCSEDSKTSFLQTFYPEPKWDNIPNQQGELPSLNNGRGSRCWSDGTQDHRWYDWRNQHWGTKWDIFDCSNDFLQEEPGTEFSMSFSTAWSPLSENCMQEISKHFPGALLTNYYEEEGEDFCGVTVAQNGIALDYSAELSEIRELYVRKEIPNLPEDADIYDAYEENELWGGFRDFLWERLDGNASDLLKELQEKVKCYPERCIELWNSYQLGISTLPVGLA